MGPLELREEPGGLRYYLNGRPIHAGDDLELQLFPNSVVDDRHDSKGPAWIVGRYEWSCRPGTRPLFYIIVLADGNVAAHFEIPDRAILRWPMMKDSSL